MHVSMQLSLKRNSAPTPSRTRAGPCYFPDPGGGWWLDNAKILGVRANATAAPSAFTWTRPSTFTSTWTVIVSLFASACPTGGPLSTIVSNLKASVEARAGVIAPASVAFIGCDKLATEQPSPDVVSLYFGVTETHT